MKSESQEPASEKSPQEELVLEKDMRQGTSGKNLPEVREPSLQPSSRPLGIMAAGSQRYLRYILFAFFVSAL